jgi:hypothetical protein
MTFKNKIRFSFFLVMIFSVPSHGMNRCFMGLPIVSHQWMAGPVLASSSFRYCSTFKPWKKLPMDTVVRDVRYDETFKILLGESGAEARAISFLNAVLAPKKTDDRIKSIRYLDGTLTSAVDRTLHFDIKIEGLCETFNGQRFIIEMQKAQVPGHINRWVYYGARELCLMGERNYKKALEAENKERKKLHLRHYQRLDPVKVVTVLDFDSLKGQEDFCNSKDIVFHWDICERRSKKISSKLLSWTYVILPRFLEKYKKKESRNFKGKPLDAWLYLMTREDQEKVLVTKEITNNDDALAEGFYRISHLSRQELESLHAGKMAYASRISLQEEKFKEGELKGKIEGKIDVVCNLLNMGVLTSKQIAQVSGLTPRQVESVRQSMNKK